MHNMYPKSPRDIAHECVESAQPEVMRFDGQNHLAWSYELPDGLGREDDGSDVLMERDDFNEALHAGLRAREENEGIRRDLIEGSIMPILPCDLKALGLEAEAEDSK